LKTGWIVKTADRNNLNLWNLRPMRGNPAAALATETSPNYASTAADDFMKVGVAFKNRNLSAAKNIAGAKALPLARWQSRQWQISWTIGSSVHS
jgi:hypothetical protein